MVMIVCFIFSTCETQSCSDKGTIKRAAVRVTCTQWPGHTYVLPKLLDHVSDQHIVKVLSSKESVSIGGLHFKHSLLNLKDGDVKCSPTEVIHSNSGGGGITK